MSNPAPASPPLPTPSLAPIERLKLKFAALPKTHRLAIIGGGSLIMLLSASALLLNLGSNKQSFEQSPLAFPSPSPQTLSRFAHDPTVATAEATLKEVTTILESQKITNTPLLPPPLNMEVNLNP